MKKGIFIISFILICYFGYAQYPITSNLGGPTTLVQNPNYGGLRGGLIPFTFADTTAASLTNLKHYAGALIYTSSPRAVWWRDLVATAWVQVLPSGGSTGTLAWVMGGNNPVVSDGSGFSLIGPQTNNGLSAITNNVVRFSINTSGAFGLGSGRDFGTAGQALLSQGNGSAPIWGTPSSTTPTWQETLTAGSALTTNNNITGAFAFSFTDPTSFKIVKSTIERLSITNSLTTIQGAGSTGASLQLSSTSAALNSTQLTELSSGNSATSQSLIDVHSDSIEINPYLGNLRIDTLTNLSTQNTILGWVQGSGQGPVGYITVGAGLSLSGGALTNTNPTAGANTALSNLASVAINTSLLPGTDNSIDVGSGTKQWRYGVYGTGISIGAAAAPAAALDIRAADLFLTSSSVDQRFIIGEGLVSATDFYAISWNRTDNQLVFNDGGVAVSMRLEGDANANLFFADATNDRIGIGDATPASLFTVGSGDLFQVNTSGDLVKLKNVTYSWPSANAAGVLTNNGSGTLSWAADFALTSGNGTTANGTAVDLGGTVGSNVAIDEDGGNDNSFDIGRNTAFSDIRMGASNFTFNGGPVQMNNYGAGAATFDASGNITSVSDMRLKNLQGMYEVGLKQLMQINPIVYKWNEKSKLETKHDYIGFSAQNVKDALGENAVGVNKDGYYSLQDRAILAAMVNSIKELKELNDNQQEQIKDLKAEVKKLKKQ